MPDKTTTLIFCLLLILANHCRAWSEAGHIAIAELAQRQVPERVQNRLNEYAAIVLAGAGEHRGRWERGYSGYSETAYLGAWPDTIRDITVEQLFRRYNVSVPGPLAAYRKETTNNWHYTNRWFYNGHDIGIPSHCGNKAYRFANRGELLPVIERLYASVEQARSDTQRAVALALLIHLLSDLHQPLHNFAGIGGDCRHDRGGTGFCLSEKSGKCETSLHRWWDSGAGWFGHPLDINQMEKWVDSADMPGEPVSAELDFQQLRKWSDESRPYSAAVYSLEQGEMPDAKYTRLAREIVKQQTILAVERLRTVLLSLAD